MTSERFAASHIDSLVFDVIGTLLDEDKTFAEASVALAAISGAHDPEALRKRWVQHLNEKMDHVVNTPDTWRPHRELVEESGREAVAENGGDPAANISPILERVDREYDAWPDVSRGIRALRDDRLVVGLSNGDLGSLARLALKNDIAWHVALSTAAVKTFKPNELAYRFAIDTLDLIPEQTLFVAAHPWDLRAAAKLGFRTAYVGRPQASAPEPSDRFDVQVDNLVQLAQQLRGQTQ